MESFIKFYADNLAKEIVKELKEEFRFDKCNFYYIQGRKKGTYCSGIAVDKGYCPEHKLNGLKKKRNYDEKKIEKWRETIHPHVETLLEPCKRGFINKESMLVFDKEYNVIGKQDNNRLVNLYPGDEELCVKNGWNYKKLSSNNE